MTHQSFPKPPQRPQKRRKGLAPRSERRIAYEEELDQMRPLLVARAHGLCEICGFTEGTVAHHRLRRSQGGKNELGNLMLLCVPCHTIVHDYPATSFAQGYLLRRPGKGTMGDERRSWTC